MKSYASRRRDLWIPIPNANNTETEKKVQVFFLLLLIWKVNTKTCTATNKCCFLSNHIYRLDYINDDRRWNTCGAEQRKDKFVEKNSRKYFVLTWNFILKKMWYENIYTQRVKRVHIANESCIRRRWWWSWWWWLQSQCNIQTGIFTHRENYIMHAKNILHCEFIWRNKLLYFHVIIFMVCLVDWLMVGSRKECRLCSMHYYYFLAIFNIKTNEKIVLSATGLYKIINEANRQTIHMHK